jgi:Mg-chelatase subunit ChlD
MAAIPNEFLCPISYDLMTDPVICEDGQTYDRVSIEAWLKTHNTSPMTNQRINAANLKPNYALKSLIANHLAAGGAAKVVAPKSTAVKEFQATAAEADGLVRITIQADPTLQPMETIVIAALDMSGSMSEAASKNAPEGGVQFDRRDLVKHSARTLAHLLAKNPRSRLSLIRFSDRADLVLPVMEMNAGGLQRANEMLDRLSPGGCTNIWDSLRLGILQVLEARKRYPNANIHLILLTDGEPTPDYTPQGGIVETFKKRAAAAGTKFTLSCFGFGTRLDTNLLQELCVAGAGTFGYIPDCSMSGTIFINYAAAALNTVATNVALKIDKEAFQIGSVQKDQIRSILIPKKALADKPDSIEILYDQGQSMKTTLSWLTGQDITDDFIRARLIEAVEGSHPAQNLFPALKGWIAAHAADSAFARQVLQDIEDPNENKGQLSKAISRGDWYGSWGKNHLASYARALRLQQCVNFKDAALQSFGGSSFRALVEVGNDIFADLPAPQPSLRSYAGAALSAGFSMGSMNTADGGCWAGWCKIKMADGSTKYTNQIRKDDVVAGGHRVVCVVRTRHIKPVKMMTDKDTLSITPWHPIRLPYASSPTWMFPAEAGSSLLKPSEENNYYVYNLVLESGHTVQIGNYEVCTLGHGFEDNEVIQHPYFGTHRVIRDLEDCHGWKKGLVTLSPNHLRDPTTGLVIRMIDYSDEC